MKQKRRWHVKLNYWIMPAITVVLAACFVFASMKINNVMKNFCFRSLNETATQFSAEIQEEVHNEQEELTLLAEIMSDEVAENPEDVSALLKAYQKQSTMDVLALLLPDSTLQFAAGDTFQPALTLDFETEEENVPYCSGICREKRSSKQKYIYQAVSVVKDNQVIGILYGFQKAENFASAFTATAYEGWCSLYIVDSSTNEFILDALHSTPADMETLDWSMYQPAKGYEKATLLEDMAAEKSGYFAFRSLSTNKTFYMRYCSAGVNRWMVQVTVPEDIVFSSARQVQKIIGIIVLLYIATFFLFFIWIFLRNHRDIKRQERQLQQRTYMYNVQRALYDAPQNPALIEDALQIVGDMMTSERVFLIVLTDDFQSENFYIWRKNKKEQIPPPDVPKLRSQFTEQWKMLSAGKTILLYAGGVAKLSSADREMLHTYSVENLLLVPLRDTKQRLRGVLGSINMQSEWADGALLECVAGSFLMAMQNARSYRLIQKMGTMDAVTGLKNRNSYQLAIGSYAEENPGTFCCIYADANGLHELNNHLGHAAGDAMLKCIGDTLKEIFGEEDSYRVGGDEFVVFCRNCPEEEVEQKLQQFHDTLGKQDYNVSVGISWLHTDVQIDRLIADAECQMYKAKRQYYQTRGELAKAREMNRKLEKILLEKKDADNFLQIISSYFLGVYVVDLATDSTRAIYVPKYFKDKLEKSGGRFFPAMQMYMVHHVLDTDEASLLEFMNYDTLREKLQSGEPLETIYRKPNGIRVRVRVYPSNQYGEEEQETFWLFEEYRLVPEEDK